MNHVLPAWDLMTGAYAAFALLAAERRRRETGAGQEIRLPLADVALASLGHIGQIAEALVLGDRPRYGNDLFGAFGRDFVIKGGGRVMIVAISTAAVDRDCWRRWDWPTTAALRTRLSLGVSFAADEGQRFIHRERLGSRCWSRRWPRAPRPTCVRRSTAWASAGVPTERHCRRCRIPLVAPRSHALFETLAQPSGHSYLGAGPGRRSKAGKAPPGLHAPRLGEHTEQVLAEAPSMDTGEIARLHDAGPRGGLGKNLESPQPSARSVVLDLPGRLLDLLRP